MGMPAARLGDPTTHGGSIVVGMPTVLIGGMPAARMGDMHVCPMLNPGTPPPPHVGGPITKGSAGVLIGGVPAARQGDMATCAGPPDSIVMGCPTVLIGETGGGGGGGGAGGGGGGGGASGGETGDGAAAGPAAGSAASDTAQDEDVEEHFLDVRFVDGGGFPIHDAQYRLTGPDGRDRTGMVRGRIRRTVEETGNHDIALSALTAANWSATAAKQGEEVDLQVDCVGIDDGTPARFELFVRDGGRPDQLVEGFDAEVSGNSAKVSWTVALSEEVLEAQEAFLRAGGYSSPRYLFAVTVGQLTTRSGTLEILDDLDITVEDDEGNALGDRPVRVHLANGEIREVTLDGSGKAKLESVAAGRFRVVVHPPQ